MLDLYDISDLLSPEEKQIQRVTREFLEKEALPHVPDWWEAGSFPGELIPQLGELGLLGANLPVDASGRPDGGTRLHTGDRSDRGTRPDSGGRPAVGDHSEESGGALPASASTAVTNVAYGLIMYELERVDSGLRSFASVQGALVMYAIWRYGSDEQKARYLPELARGTTIGCFGLTEHEGGSDPGAMSTRARRDGDDYVITGTKMWITNGTMADVALIWARDEEGEVRGVLVPTDSPGFTANPVHHKMSMRMSDTAELVLDEVRVPASSALPEAVGMRAPLSCLTQARFGIAWGVLGAMEAVYEEALAFAKSRVTFGKPIAARQLVQEKLVDMAGDHTRGLLLAWRLARLKDEAKLAHQQVSLAKRANVRAALQAARAARDILGASGISLEHHAIRHMLNLETVFTYEGAHDIHTLILGRHLTGHDALA